ncbi:probable disease resistance protein At4g27220 [Fagus crenata]
MEEAACGQVIGNLVTPAVQYGHAIIGCLTRKYGYVSNLRENLAKLQDEETSLCDKEAYVTTMLERNKLKMEMTPECTTWLDDVQKMKKKLEELNRNPNTCFCGLCPFHSLLMLGKTVVKNTEEVIALKNRQQNLTIWMKRAPTPPIPVILKHPKKIDDVPSLNEHVETLLKWLKDDKCKRIGIWGLPGVGKTTIMENLNDKVGKTQLFDFVFFIDVSIAKSMRKLQEQLGERLQLEFQRIRQSDQRADMISKELVNKKYLLLLDGVFLENNLKDLNDVGIHENHEHGKVVFATRYRDVCRSADEEIKITRLSENDGQNLFRKIVGDIIDQPDIKPIVKVILRECGGMPQVIMLIAKKLRNVDNLALWRGVLFNLRSTSMFPMQEMEEVYKPFKMVYDQLTISQKPCLYWTIFPLDDEVHEDYLIECWKAEQFIAHAKTLGEARDQGQGILNELEDKSVLEKCSKAGHFKMPVFLQRMAVKIRDQIEEASNFLVGEGKEIHEGEWQKAQRVSLIRQNLRTLPDKPACSKILTLLLQKNPHLEKIPEFFFEYMSGLRVLDLCDTRIMSVPPSISSLINLRVLYLNNCGNLEMLPPQLKELKSLEILDLRNTRILSLPKEIAQLTGLKCLRVSFKQNCSSTNGNNGQPPVMIPSNVIASLSSLEELSIDVDFTNEIWNQIADTIAGEVAKLKLLASLCFYFPELRCFETFIENSQAWNRNNMEHEDYGLRSFRIVVGNHNIENFIGFDFFGYTAERHLRYGAGEVIPVAFSKVLKQANSLELIGHHSAKNLSIFGANNLERLRACTIEECNEIESIMDDTIATEALQKLQLINLPKLVTIYKGSIVSRSLDKITTLTLKGCPGLKRLFPQASVMVQLLRNLQDLEVEDCSKIEEIIEGGSIIEIGAFPKLKKVVLCDLPRLFHICEDASLEWPSLETMMIKTCPKLKLLPFRVGNATSLRVIECTENWWNQLVWPDDSVKERLKDLHSFT